MSDKPEIIYADGPATVVMRNNMVRLTFGQQGPGEEGEDAPIEPTHEIVMPLNGMLRLIGISQQVLDRLEDAGMVSRPGGEGSDS